LASGEKVEIKMTGMISYSNQQRLLFVNSRAVNKGGDAIATLIYEQLRAMKWSGSPAAEARTLFIQFDGGSENVNK
jgi:hypothetical protein